MRKRKAPSCTEMHRDTCTHGHGDHTRTEQSISLVSTPSLRISHCLSRRGVSFKGDALRAPGYACDLALVPGQAALSCGAVKRLPARRANRVRRRSSDPQAALRGAAAQRVGVATPHPQFDVRRPVLRAKHPHGLIRRPQVAARGAPHVARERRPSRDGACEDRRPRCLEARGGGISGRSQPLFWGPNARTPASTPQTP